MIRLTHIATMSLFICTTAGCWEVVPYKGEASLPPTAPAETASPTATEPPGGDELFGDEADAPDVRQRPAPAAEIVPPGSR